jgi:F-type H+-transporting ATPase subunit delta
MASAIGRLVVARVSRVTVRATPQLVRCFAKKADKNDGALSQSEITKLFLDLDSSLAAPTVSDLPIKLSGRSGELVESLYASTNKTKSFEKAVKELEGVVAAIQSAGLVVDRFFSSTNYSPEESQLVVDLLLTNKEPLTSFASIKNADVKDLIVDNEGNLDTWRNVRKQIQGLNLSEAVKTILETLAAEGRLDLVIKVAEKAATLRAVTSKSMDVQVASAVALTKDQQAAIAKALPAYTPAGTTLNLNYTVDSAIMGGLLISLQNQIIDLSSSSRLVELAAAARSQKLM